MIVTGSFDYRSTPSIIRRCQAATKAAAAVIFSLRLNVTANGEDFTAAELLPAIKQEAELTAMERAWIAEEDPAMLDL